MSRKRGPYSSPAQTERRLNILRSTLDVIRTQGLGDFTLKKVADHAGVSLKTLHNIYGGRDELLLKVASLELDSIQVSEMVTSDEPGIPQLLSFTAAVMERFREEPALMAVILSIVFQSDDDARTSEERVRHIYQAATRSLEAAEREGELSPGADIETIAQMIAGNQWGAVFLWTREQISLERFINLTQMNHCVTLLPFTVGTRRDWLSRKLEELVIAMASEQEEPAKTKNDRSIPISSNTNA